MREKIRKRTGNANNNLGQLKSTLQKYQSPAPLVCLEYNGSLNQTTPTITSKLLLPPTIMQYYGLCISCDIAKVSHLLHLNSVIPLAATVCPAHSASSAGQLLDSRGERTKCEWPLWLVCYWFNTPPPLYLSSFIFTITSSRHLQLNSSSIHRKT